MAVRTAIQPDNSTQTGSFHVEVTLGVAGFKPDVHAKAMSRTVVYEPGLGRHIISTLVEKELKRRDARTGDDAHGR
jgi:hypothetical protein